MRNKEVASTVALLYRLHQGLKRQRRSTCDRLLTIMEASPSRQHLLKRYCNDCPALLEPEKNEFMIAPPLLDMFHGRSRPL